MIENYSRSFEAVIKHEGGFVHDLRDLGGPTNLGVTIGTLSSWLGRPATVDDVKALTPASVMGLYHDRYWRPVDCDSLPGGVDYFTFDSAVQHGPARAARMLQRAAGVKEDGSIGPVTLAAVNHLGARAVVANMSSIREAFYRDLSGFEHFGKGWINRLRDVTVQATAWA